MIKQWAASAAVSVILILVLFGVFIWSPIAFLVIGGIAMVVDITVTIKEALFPRR